MSEVLTVPDASPVKVGTVFKPGRLYSLNRGKRISGWLRWLFARDRLVVTGVTATAITMRRERWSWLRMRWVAR